MVEVGRNKALCSLASAGAIRHLSNEVWLVHGSIMVSMVASGSPFLTLLPPLSAMPPLGFGEPLSFSAAIGMAPPCPFISNE